MLDDEGGFDFISSTVKDSENMESGAMRSMFLTSDDSAKDRTILQRRLSSWVKLLESQENVGEMIEASQETGETSTTILNENVKRALDKTKAMEESYRTLGSFYANAGGSTTDTTTSLGAGTYYVTITDVAGDSIVDSVMVMSPMRTLTTTIVNTSCFSGSNGTVG